MATISNPYYNDENFLGTNTISLIDDRIRTLSADIRERLQNAGLAWTNAAGVAQAYDGVPFASPNAYVANAFTIYANSSGAPDVAGTPLAQFRAASSRITTALTVSGALNDASGSVKRIMLCGAGMPTSGNVLSIPLVMPFGQNGTLKEVMIARPGTFFLTTDDFYVYSYTSFAANSDLGTTFPHGNAITSALSPSTSAKYCIRRSVSVGVTSGALLSVYCAALTASTPGEPVLATLYIELT